MKLRALLQFLLALHACLCMAIKAEVTFNRDIAPLIYRHCYGCHREGEPAPFELRTYEDASKRPKLILELVRTRQMPPWMPSANGVEFEHERRLSEQEISLFESWVAEGAPEGDPADLPPPPRFETGWTLGKPDLVVQLPSPYKLAAEGEDTYRNFVIPLPLTSTQHVAGYEFRPGNTRAVHHAFISIDRSGDSRRQDAQDAEAGFPGLHTSSKLEPSYGFFTSWQPGKVPSRYRDGMAWPVLPESDLVLQLHLQHTGKEELVQPTVGFYFTNAPSAAQPLKICVSSMNIEIPAGSSNTVIRASYKLSADTDALGVLPHAHYLARRIEGFAILPDGSRQELLLIKEWNFDWQGDYTYKKPIFLPKNTIVQALFTFDNSEGNPRNPNRPPKHTSYGLQSTDEMAELWLQLLPRTREGTLALERDWGEQVVRDSLSYNRMLLQKDPRDPKALADAAVALMHMGQLGDAVRYFKRSLQIKPAAETHYHYALTLEQAKQDYPARLQYEAALQLEPSYHKAMNNLGLLFLKYGEFDKAEEHFKKVLRLRPEDGLAKANLLLTEKVAKEYKK